MPEYEARNPRRQLAQNENPFHVATFRDGTCFIEFHRVTGGYLLRFPGLSDFHVSTDGDRIASYPVPGISAATVEHLYLNQVLPMAMSRSGQFVFHASAVEIEHSAVAFLGEAGRGKSTLAAAFATRGMRFLTDDGLVLDAAEGGYDVRPSHPSIRLWQDSHAQLFPAGADCAPAVSYTSKARLLLGDGHTYCVEPRRLRAAYHLTANGHSNVGFRRLEPAKGLIAWAKHAFILDVEDQAFLADHFIRLAGLASRVPCFELDYPRDFGKLDDVISCIVAHAQALDDT